MLPSTNNLNMGHDSSLEWWANGKGSHVAFQDLQ